VPDVEPLPDHPPYAASVPLSIPPNNRNTARVVEPIRRSSFHSVAERHSLPDHPPYAASIPLSIPPYNRNTAPGGEPLRRSSFHSVAEHHPLPYPRSNPVGVALSITPYKRSAVRGGLAASVQGDREGNPYGVIAGIRRPAPSRPPLARASRKTTPAAYSGQPEKSGSIHYRRLWLFLK
jgi:hypothetical protein